MTDSVNAINIWELTKRIESLEDDRRILASAVVLMVTMLDDSNVISLTNAEHLYKNLNEVTGVTIE